jgi:hypothetical protein
METDAILLDLVRSAIDLRFELSDPQSQWLLHLLELVAKVAVGFMRRRQRVVSLAHVELSRRRRGA